jgi:hypothetical protein
VRSTVAILWLVFFLAAVPADARRRDSGRLLDAAWPARTAAPLDSIGRGVAIVFSPDLSVPGNCAFYTALGFRCFADTQWSRVLDTITAENLSGDHAEVRTLILETHGTNGNGLKLQASYDPAADRSYISIGALQERLEEAGVRNVILSACNSGRLLRPQIVRALNRNPGDPLFLPPTCEIIDATERWHPRRTNVTIIAPDASHIESTLVAPITEFPSALQDELECAAAANGVHLPREIAISDMLMQILTGDDSLVLSVARPVEKLSRTRSDDAFSDRLFARLLDTLTARMEFTRDQRFTVQPPPLRASAR